DLRVHADRLEVEDTRPIAVERLTVLRGPARLAYLSLDAGNTLRGVQGALQQAPGIESTEAEVIQEWFQQWLDARLVIQEGPRYLSLATNRAERVRPAANVRTPRLRSAPTPA